MESALFLLLQEDEEDEEEGVETRDRVRVKGAGRKGGSVKTTLVEAPPAITWTQTSRRDTAALDRPQHPNFMQQWWDEMRWDAKLTAQCIHHALSLMKGTHSSEACRECVRVPAILNYFRIRIFIKPGKIIMLFDVIKPTTLKSEVGVILNQVKSTWFNHQQLCIL